MARKGARYQTLDEVGGAPETTVIDVRAGKTQRRVKILGSCLGVASFILVLALILAVVLILTLSPQPGCSLDTSQRFNCFPEARQKPSRSQCEARGCCWADTGTPSCFFPSEYGYSVHGGVRETSFGEAASLRRLSGQPTLFGNDVDELCVDFIFETDSRLRVKIYDPSHARYEVPVSTERVSGKAKSPQYKIDISQNPFTFTIKRPTGVKLFSTATSLIFSDQFLSLSAALPSANVYGLGEHVARFKLNISSVLTLFSRDQPPNPDLPGNNLYGVHPFYLCVEEDGQSHGVFLLNSNAMEVGLQPTPAITYRTIGGILDFYFFLGPSPESVVQQYTELIGRPFMPPYWSLGFHLCRWGYGTANNTMTIVKRMREEGIPQDTQWNDIDYMHEYLDFTYDDSRFKELPSLVQDLHDHGQKYVVIVDPGINSQQPAGTYPPFDDGHLMNVFITNSTGQPIIGVVWPNETAFPDFTHPNSSAYWENEISKFHDSIKMDGLWIDMNEPSNFVPGQVCADVGNCCPSSPLNHPPFLPRAIDPSTGIVDKTLCMTARQTASLHYNVHSLYGHTEANTTMRALTKILGSRSLVISRSTYPGSGTHTGHWLGDNASQWKHMANSIPGILDFSLFGIPLVGADICGFFGNTTEQLCTRWQQLGAFYPFSRNHNSIGNIPQDPAVWSEASINSTRSILLLRYKLLPFLYTLFHMAHINGTTVARPLLFEFPSDKNTWDIDKQFLWGSSLLISPVLTEGATTVKAYLPATRWYSLATGVVQRSGFVELDAPMDTLPLHVRGGSVLPMQLPNTTTTASRENPFSLLVALDEKGKASGQLFLDDGESLSTYEEKQYSFITFQCSSGSLESTVEVANYLSAANSTIDEVTFFGVDQSPLNVTVNGADVPFSWSVITHVLDVEVSIKDFNKGFVVVYHKQ